MRRAHQPRTSLAALLLLACTVSAQAGTNVHLRVNQLGYRPEMAKMALLMSRTQAVAGTSFTLVDVSSGSAVFTNSVGANRGSYGNYAHLCPMDFSAWTAAGQYQLVAQGETSPVFAVHSNVYAQLQPALLAFFNIQRCGTNEALHHGPCHLNARRISGGPQDGQLRDVTGGWHDAGDYLKFMLEEAGATLMMLQAWRENPAACPDGDTNGVPDVLDEALIGARWIRDMWDPTNQVFYFQETSTNPDHHYWRLPEGDDLHANPAVSNRVIYACETNKGANVAGMAAAALAEAAMAWGATNASFHAPALSADLLSAATGLYAFGSARTNPQPRTFNAFETNWKDYMGVAATLLYEATLQTQYLAHARQYAAELSTNFFYFNSIYGLDAMLHYRLAQVDTSHWAVATNYLHTDVSWYEQQGLASSFRECMDEMQWGSMEVMAGKAVEAFWYERLTGYSSFRDVVAEDMLHYLLGNNPWGVSFVAGLGTRWAHDQHHQISDLLGVDVTGSMNEGPITRSSYNAEGITLADPDEYADFQAAWAVYHDDLEDYTSNEPIIAGNGMGLALAAWFVGTPIHPPDYSTNVTHIRIDFGSVTSPSTGNWNNVTSAAAGTNIAHAVNSNGTPSGVSVSFPAAWSAAADTGVNAAGPFPESAQTDFLYAGTTNGTARAIRFNGLEDSKRFTLRAFASREAVTGRLVDYAVGGVTQTVDVGGNTTNLSVFTNLAPVGGVMELVATENNSANFTYIGALELVQEAAAFDSDGDGMPDDWETTNFGTLTNSATADADSDGFSNGQEHTAGTHPALGNSFLRLAGQRMTVDGAVLTWDAVTGRLYGVHWSAGLTAGFQTIETNVATGIFTDSVHVVEPMGCYRLDVRLP